MAEESVSPSQYKRKWSQQHSISKFKTLFIWDLCNTSNT